eukprot:UN05031
MRFFCFLLISLSFSQLKNVECIQNSECREEEFCSFVVYSCETCEEITDCYDHSQVSPCEEGNECGRQCESACGKGSDPAMIQWYD